MTYDFSSQSFVKIIFLSFFYIFLFIAEILPQAPRKVKHYFYLKKIFFRLTSAPNSGTLGGGGSECLAPSLN